MVIATFVVGVLKMGIIVSKVGIEPNSHVFQASVLTILPPRLPDIIILPTCLCSFMPETSMQTTTVIINSLQCIIIIAQCTLMVTLLLSVQIACQHHDPIFHIVTLSGF